MITQSKINIDILKFSMQDNSEDKTKLNLEMKAADNW